MGDLRVVCYLRVSTDSQEVSGAGLGAQRATLETTAASRGWTVVEWVTDTASGKDTDRPGFQRALGMLARGEAEAVAASKLDRLSRSVLDFASLMERSRDEGWSVIALDLGVDTSTATGRFMASIIAAVAELERTMIGERTSAAMKVRKAQGVHCGRPRRIPENVVEWVRECRANGWTYRAIARFLDERQMPTASGGASWATSTLRRIA